MESDTLKNGDEIEIYDDRNLFWPSLRSYSHTIEDLHPQMLTICL